ncbi:MAG: pyruvate kinase [Acetobacteraceae bacterium]
MAVRPKLRRRRRTKIIATLGPASSTIEILTRLFQAGADVFRLNFSHGTHEDHAARFAMIRELEDKFDRPIGILADVQGPKLRVGRFSGGRAHLQTGRRFRLDLNATPGDSNRVNLPHPEIIDAATIGVPDVVLPIPALTEKDRIDLEFAVTHGANYIGLSFVQRPQDVAEAKKLIDGRAWTMVKLEKPQALDNLDAILALTDAVMVARGDLGVELPPEEVPLAQKRIVRLARQLGKPVVVATQMLESMITAPAPTRAEASDVATAVFDGADAVMLSGETAAGQYPYEAVNMMDRIVARVEQDAGWRSMIDSSRAAPEHSAAGAIASAASHIVHTIGGRAIVAFTASGSTALRVARDRPDSPVIGLTPLLETARRMAVVWGVHAVVVPEVHSMGEAVTRAARVALTEGFASHGDEIVVTAGVPFGQPGTTNALRVATVK